MNTEARIQLRLPPELKEWLKLRAEKNYRSVNAEIMAILADTRRIEAEQKGN